MRPPAFQDAFHERNILVTDHRWPVLRGRVHLVDVSLDGGNVLFAAHALLIQFSHGDLSG